MTKLILTSLALPLALGACKSRDNLSALREADGEAARFGFADVRNLVETKDLRSVDALLPLMPEDIRSRFVLLSDSKSTQEAHSGAPRVLIYTEGARFVVSFNGDEDAAGFDTIETAELNSDTATYTFREIEFRANEKAHVSEDNPGACAACHRKPLRPSWEGWPRWPEAYFGKDTSADGSSVSSDERSAFSAFLADRGASGRYKHLIRLDQYANDADRLARGEPANGFNQIILGRIEDMIVVEMKNHPRFARLRPVFEAAIIGCKEFPGIVPAAEREALIVSYESSRKDTLLKNAKAGPRTIALRWLFDGAKLPTSHWSPSFRTKYSFRRSKAGGDDLDLVRAFKEKIGFEATARAYLDGSATLDNACGALKEAAAAGDSSAIMPAAAVEAVPGAQGPVASPADATRGDEETRRDP